MGPSRRIARSARRFAEGEEGQAEAAAAGVAEVGRLTGTKAVAGKAVPVEPGSELDIQCIEAAEQEPDSWLADIQGSLFAGPVADRDIQWVGEQKERVVDAEELD